MATNRSSPRLPTVDASPPTAARRGCDRAGGGGTWADDSRELPRHPALHPTAAIFDASRAVIWKCIQPYRLGGYRNCYFVKFYCKYLPIRRERGAPRSWPILHNNGMPTRGGYPIKRKHAPFFVAGSFHSRRGKLCIQAGRTALASKHRLRAPATPLNGKRCIMRRKRWATYPVFNSNLGYQPDPTSAKPTHENDPKKITQREPIHLHSRYTRARNTTKMLPAHVPLHDQNLRAKIHSPTLTPRERLRLPNTKKARQEQNSTRLPALRLPIST